MNGTYKNFDSKTPEEIYDSWLSLKDRCNENVGDALSASARLSNLIKNYGDDADAAVYAFLGSDDATMLLDNYNESIDLGYVSMSKWYEDYIIGNLAYMPLNYGPEDCYTEMRDALLPEVMAFEENRPAAREALDYFLELFCGDTFDGLFGFEDLS